LDFENLCRKILQFELRLPVEAYSPGPDGGADGMFRGPADGGSLERGVLQVKHRSDPRASLASDFRNVERPKIEEMVREGACDRYVLMTNVRLSKRRRDVLDREVRAAGVERVDILGYEWIIDVLESRSELRSLHPRLYGFQDIRYLLDDRVHERSRVVLQTRAERLAPLVDVAALAAARAIFAEHRCVVLTGAPGAGKSVIATALILGA
ncbi:hypothetical protein B7486_72330, partial [cyanobacterium TDX16]